MFYVFIYKAEKNNQRQITPTMPEKNTKKQDEEALTGLFRVL